MGVYLTNEEFLEKLLIKNPDVIPLDKYEASKKPISFKCKKCGYVWSARPNDILAGKGCPYCANKVVIPGKNDIATTNPEFVRYFANLEDAYTFSIGSNKKALMRCPHCGFERMYKIADLKWHGFGCSICSDGISYPNKFARAMLNQLPIDNFIPEYSPDWANNRSYDDYFEYNGSKFVLEMDGEFHYRQIKNANWPLEKVQQNDYLKNKIAEEHGIIMVRINSRLSTMESLRKNITESILGDVFDLSKINWLKCNEVATDGNVKEICEYFEQHKTIDFKKNIAKHFNINISTLERYIKRGITNGWCSDDVRQYVF